MTYVNDYFKTLPGWLMILSDFSRLANDFSILVKYFSTTLPGWLKQFFQTSTDFLRILSDSSRLAKDSCRLLDFISTLYDLLMFKILPGWLKILSYFFRLSTDSFWLFQTGSGFFKTYWWFLQTVPTLLQILADSTWLAKDFFRRFQT